MSKTSPNPPNRREIGAVSTSSPGSERNQARLGSNQQTTKMTKYHNGSDSSSDEYDQTDIVAIMRDMALDKARKQGN